MPDIEQLLKRANSLPDCSAPSTNPLGEGYSCEELICTFLNNVETDDSIELTTQVISWTHDDDETFVYIEVISGVESVAQPNGSAHLALLQSDGTRTIIPVLGNSEKVEVLRDLILAVLAWRMELPDWADEWLRDESDPIDIDLSAPTYEEFLNVLFRSGRRQGIRLISTSAIRTLGYIIRLLTDLPSLSHQYSQEELGDGLDKLINCADMDPPLNQLLTESESLCVLSPDVNRHLRLPSLRAKLKCIDAFYEFFNNYSVALEEVCHLAWMWGDVFSTSFWTTANRRDSSKLTYHDLNATDAQILDAMCTMFAKVLELDDTGIHPCALHGLGHLGHPHVRQIVQNYIDRHIDTASPDCIAWMKQCRDGVCQ